MPKSRTRRSRRRSARPRRPGHPAALTSLSAEDREMAQLVRAVDAAEARGDAEAALDLVEATPVSVGGPGFWRPVRLERLLQVAMLDLLPRWAMARWALAQAAATWGDPDRQRRAMQVALDAGAGHHLPAGMGDLDRRVRIVDHDWVFRQALLYESGALVSHLGAVSPDLMRRADNLVVWSQQPLGGYAYLGTGDRTTRWSDLSTGALVATDDLGSSAVLVPGDHVIGRLVPSEGQRLFESAPLRVPHAVAQRVAADPGSWTEVLADARRSGAGVHLPRQHFGLLHDLTPRQWQDGLVWAAHDRSLRDDAEFALDPEGLAELVLHLVRDLHRDRPGPGESEPDAEVVACLAAAVLHPQLFLGLLHRVGPRDHAALGSLARRTAPVGARQWLVLAAACDTPTAGMTAV